MLHVGIMIVKTGIYLDKLLDLTDIEIANKINELWIEYIKVCKIYESNESLGKKLNVLFEYGLKKQYNVIKVHGKYNGVPLNNLWDFDFRSKKVEPTTNVKCIYCVKDSEAIDGVQLVEE